MTSFNPNPRRPHQRNQRPIIIQQNPAPPRYRIRSGWIVTFVVGLGLVFMMLTTGIPLGWGDVMGLAGIGNASAFTQIGLLGLGLIVLTLIAKAMRGRR